MDVQATCKYISEKWDNSIIPTLQEYIRIPNQSPMFEKNWAELGNTERAVQLFVKWVESQNIAGLKLEVLRAEGRTPLIFIEVESQPAGNEHCVLMYGHLDKQPPLLPWAEGLHPYEPVIRDGKLYGRGGADDGYAIFGSLTAISNLHAQKLPHARCLILIEASEESGSPDLPHYVQILAPRIKQPDLVVCLDSGCATYDTLWMTTSLRGLIGGTLTVSILNEGVHSGLASGIVPSSFRILRQVLNRIEDVNTGEILVKELYAAVPEIRVEQTKAAAITLGPTVAAAMPFVDGAKPVTNDTFEQLMNRNWRPTLSVTGIGGMPSLENAGNVLRTHTAVKLSIRIPPGVDAKIGAAAVKKALESDAPYGAMVTFDCDKSGSGWHCPILTKWAEESFKSASNNYFKKPADYIGEGGSIPLMGQLTTLFPNSQFCVTGLLGPGSNAHGPNEFLDIEFAKKLNCCVSQVLYDHYLAHK